MFGYGKESDSILNSLNDHWKIYVMLKNHDDKGVAMKMKKHVANMEKRVKMTSFHIDTESLPRKIKEWGSLVDLVNKQTADTTAEFSLSLISYEKEHYSGFHNDTEYIYIIEGKGRAKIAGNEISFAKGSLLVIPAGAEHAICVVEQGPVRALLVHVR